MEKWAEEAWEQTMKTLYPTGRVSRYAVNVDVSEPRARVKIWDRSFKAWCGLNGDDLRFICYDSAYEWLNQCEHRGLDLTMEVQGPYLRGILR